MSRSILNSLLRNHPRYLLAVKPSSVHRMVHMEKELGTDVELWIKRDDLLKPFFGNKLRYIEYILGEYYRSGADCLVHAGGLTSNFMCSLAMIGAEFQIPVHLILTGERPSPLTGNPLLCELFGAHVTYTKGREGTSNSSVKTQIAERLIAEGLKPFVIDYPLSNFLPYLGYINCYAEIMDQVDGGECPKPDHIILCSGWHSYLGLRIASDLIGDSTQITAIHAGYWAGSGLDQIYPQEGEFLLEKVKEFSQFLEIELPTHSFDMDDSYVGSGYGITDERCLQAMHLAAKSEGVLLDPIYSAKAMAGLIDYIHKGRFFPGDRVLFIHTGGFGNVFNYNQDISNLLVR